MTGRGILLATLCTALVAWGLPVLIGMGRATVARPASPTRRDGVDRSRVP